MLHLAQKKDYKKGSNKIACKWAKQIVNTLPLSHKVEESFLFLLAVIVFRISLSIRL